MSELVVRIRLQGPPWAFWKFLASMRRCFVRIQAIKYDLDSEVHEFYLKNTDSSHLTWNLLLPSDLTVVHSDTIPAAALGTEFDFDKKSIHTFRDLLNEVDGIIEKKRLHRRQIPNLIVTFPGGDTFPNIYSNETEPTRQ